MSYAYIDKACTGLSYPFESTLTGTLFAPSAPLTLPVISLVVSNAPVWVVTYITFEPPV
jgi:hypothetical protein